MRFDIKAMLAGTIIGALSLTAQAQNQAAGETTGTGEQSAAAAQLRQAPDFAAKDETGKEHKLSDFAGKTLVLFWTNPGKLDGDKLKGGCPFIMDRVSKGAFNTLADQLKAENAVLVAVNSSGVAAEETKGISEKFSQNYPTLLDDDGKIGQSFGAKKTPHVFVVNPQGQIIYDGALNDNESPDPAGDASAKNYPLLAAKAAKEGKTPEVTKTASYGCGVKYRK